MQNLTIRRAREALHYDQETGLLTWLIVSGKARIGQTAGSKTKDGYLVIGIDNQRHLAHRLAWFWMIGEWPNPECDHRDNDGLNNKWSNLRAATPLQNRANVRVYKNNKCGVKGVYKLHGKYRAMIRENGKGYHLGVFDTIEEASGAYKTAAIERFGSFAKG